MANDFKAFINGAKEIGTIKYVVSERFKDESGNPIEWELAPLTSATDEALRKSCTTKRQTGKRGQYTQDIDTDLYVCKMCTHSITYPNLNDAEFQDAFEVQNAEDLLKAMLLSGEYTELKAKVMEVNGYDTSMDDLVEEAKN